MRRHQLSSSIILISLIFISSQAFAQSSLCDYTQSYAYGQARVYLQGPLYTPSLSNVCLFYLGDFDPETGYRVSGNGGYLNGKYLETDLYSIDEFAQNPPYNQWPNVPNFYSASNDFQIDPNCWDNPQGGQNPCPQGVNQRQAHLWSSEAHQYYFLTDYRMRFLNDPFIDQLQLDPEIAKNLKTRQFRPDLDVGGNERLDRPIVVMNEFVIPAGISLFPDENMEAVTVRTRGPNEPHMSAPPMGLAYDPEVTIGDYAGLMANWVMADNRGFPSDYGFGQNNEWQNNILPALNDGLSGWVAYRTSGHSEIYSNTLWTFRTWADRQGIRACGGSNYPCDKGQAIRNVMMFDEVQVDKNGVFPYSLPTVNYVFDDIDGPGGSDLAAGFFAAVFYDISHEAGLGDQKADLLAWKTISLINNRDYFPMREFGSTVIQAARLLWPGTEQAGPEHTPPGLETDMMSMYETDIADVLVSRGIPLYGVGNFRDNLPPALGPTLRGLTLNSSHPNTQPTVNSYGASFSGADEYTVPGSPAEYITVQLYKHSKYGPCDRIEMLVPDGTYNNGIPNTDGTVIWTGQDRDVGNKVVFIPNWSNNPNTVRVATFRNRCANESTGYYVEDVRPFGFRGIKAMRNGFSITPTDLGITSTNLRISSYNTTHRYSVRPADPSVATLGEANYDYEVEAADGSLTNFSGNSTQAFVFSVKTDEPFVIRITRTRGQAVDELEFRERANDFARSDGMAFVGGL